MRMPSLKRDLAAAVGFILLGAGPPVWAGSWLDVVRDTASLGRSVKTVKLAAASLDRGAGVDQGHKVPGLGLRVEGELADALALDGGSVPRVLVVFPRSDGMSQVAGEQTIADEMLQLAGGINAFVGTQGYISPTAAAVRSAQPDVLLLTTYGLSVLGGEAGLWSTPSLAQLDRTKVRLVVMDDHLLLGFGPRVSEAAVALSTQLYGERTP